MMRPLNSLSWRWPVLVLVWVLAGVLPAHGQTTALFVHSESGDIVGGGITRTLTPSDAMFTARRNNGNGVTVALTGPSASVSWRLDFAAKRGIPLATGLYPSALLYGRESSNGLHVWNTTTCSGTSQMGGRFLVRELIVGTGDVILAFAVDFEQHCGNGAPGLFGALRYQSSISDLRPFEGQYPIYSLSVTTPNHGRITGSGIACGGGQTQCQLSLAGGAPVTLTATPDPGHLFAGWGDDCIGGATTTVYVTFQKICTAFFEPVVSATPRTLIYVDSQTGDYVAQGIKTLFGPAKSAWTLTADTARRTVAVDIVDRWESFGLVFSAPKGRTLSVGEYNGAGRYPFTALNGLDVTIFVGCNRLSGRFNVLELEIASDGTVTQFAVDFEQHCENRTPALFGAIRYNSALDIIPFGGAYPANTLTLTPSVHGRITAPGLECGPTSSRCVLTFTSRQQVTLTATPNPGYTFAGWTDDCRGAETTSVDVNGGSACAATFQRIESTTPRTLLSWDLQSGNEGGGATASPTAAAVLSPFNSIWEPTVFRDGNFIRFRVDGIEAHEHRYLVVNFSAPASEVLQVGRRYLNVPKAGPGPSEPWFSLMATGSTAAAASSRSGKWC